MNVLSFCCCWICMCCHEILPFSKKQYLKAKCEAGFVIDSFGFTSLSSHYRSSSYAFCIHSIVSQLSNETEKMCCSVLWHLRQMPWHNNSNNKKSCSRTADGFNRVSPFVHSFARFEYWLEDQKINWTQFMNKSLLFFRCSASLLHNLWAHVCLFITCATVCLNCRDIVDELAAVAEIVEKWHYISIHFGSIEIKMNQFINFHLESTYWDTIALLNYGFLLRDTNLILEFSRSICQKFWRNSLRRKELFKCNELYYIK